jgi:hypothetical protein
MRERTIHRAIEAVKEKGANTDSQLYAKIEEMPGESIYALSKAMRWSTGKTYTAARRLEQAGMISIEKVTKSNRQVLVVRPKAKAGQTDLAGGSHAREVVEGDAAARPFRGD